MLRKRKMAEQVPEYRVQRTIRHLLALAVALMGMTDMISTVSHQPAWGIVLDAWMPDVQYSLARLLLLCGFFLLMLAPGLARGKQGAWRVAVCLLALSLTRDLFSSRQIFSLITTGLLLILLTILVQHFQARSDPPSFRRGSVALLMGLGVVLLYTLYGMVILHPQLEHMLDRSGLGTMLFRILTNTPLHLARGTSAFFLGHALPMLCLSAVLYGIGQILRPVASVLFPTEQQRRVVAQLLRRYGENSISYFALDHDKSYFFTTCGRAVISYVLVGNVAVVAGDPIGSSETIPLAIKQFLAFCQEQDWRVVFWQVREQLTACYRAVGLHLLKIGEDAVVPTSTFTLAGKALANVRTSVRRAEKEGIRVVFWREAIQDAEQRSQVERISRAWLAQRGGKEMGFSMGRLLGQGPDDQLFALAVDAANHVHAFISLVPIYGRQGWALDLMRRAETASPGAMECLLVHTIAAVKAQGAAMVSLGLAPLSDVNASEQTLLGKGIDVLVQRTGRPKKQQALFSFKNKFHPCWESRYLVYSDTLTLPKAGWAIYRAHYPEHSLVLACAHLLRAWYPDVRIARERTVKALVH